MLKHSLSKWLNILVILSILLPSGAANAFSPTRNPTQSAVDSAIFRTTIKVDGTARWKRLEQLQVRILLEGSNWAEVLVTDQQLETLARLRFEPNGTDGVGSLVKTAAQKTPDLAPKFNSLLAQADQGTASGAFPDVNREAALKATIAGLGVEQANALATLTAVDDDADGLTNTQEQWWCTDPLNAYTREDPNKTGSGIHKDGEYVSRLLQYLYHPEQGDNRLGAPFAGWPMLPGDGHFNANCLDADRDSVPDLAELYVIGSNPNAESTARDRYDDGQKLFGLTPPSWGYLPRAEDGQYASANLPGYVQWPGRSLFAAAIAQPKIGVVESSLHVATVNGITTDHTITSGTEKSYSTAKTEGVSKSESDTTTWNEWEETSNTHPTSLIFLDSNQISNMSPTWIIPLARGIYTVGKAIVQGCQAADMLNGPGSCQKGAKWAWNNGARIASDAFKSVKKVTTDVVTKSKDWIDNNLKLNSCSVGIPPQITCEIGFKDKQSNTDPLEKSHYSGSENDSVGGLGGHQFQNTGTQDPSLTSYYPLQYPQMAPVPTTTETKGSSWGGAHTVTNTSYQEQTVTNGEAFSTSDAWGIATAVDSAHAADLWFTYTVSNAGTDFANEIGNLAFNLYIGDDPNPVYTYFAAPEIGGDGKLRNFMPGETHTYTSHRIPLNLDQMKAIDLEQPVRIVLEDYSFGAGEQFYQDAINSSLQISIEDGPEDGDQLMDSYIFPTWGGSEKVLDVLARYFPHTTNIDGALTAIWTPEYRSDTPTWCQEARVVNAGGQRAVWCKHTLSTADWWNIYTSGMGDGSEGLQDTPALPNSVALFRFNQDSDLDGYSDSTEIQLGTETHNAASFPHPEMLAGINNLRSGNNVVSTLSLLNKGVYDAYGVEAVMIAPDDSITITNNTVGGSGRVKALKQVVVGSSIQAPTVSASTWAGTAKPSSGGYFTGSADRTYTFSVNCATPGGCDVSSGTWILNWSDDGGASGTLNFGSGYASPNLLAVGALGVKVSLMSGKVNNGNTFTVAAKTPRDTFQYTINREPYTAPVVIVSYNDPQGNHRFMLPSATMALSKPTDNLAGFAGQMLQNPGVQMVTPTTFAAGANTTNLVVNNPSGKTLTNAKLFLEFIDPTGNVVAETTTTQTLSVGPSVVPVSWNSSAFSPAYDPLQDYIVMAFWTDLQGNIIATTGRPLSSFQVDPKPGFAMNTADSTWNFGSAAQGTLLKRTFSFANTGQLELLTYVEAPSGVNISQTGSRQVSPADLTSYEIALNTSSMPLGAYDKTITIHTSDPVVPTRTVRVTGTVTAGTADTAAGAVQRPLDFTANIAGSHTQGEWYQFRHDKGPAPISLQPVRVYSQDYSQLWGMGEYATQFGVGTTSYEIFGDGHDGDLVVSSGQSLTIDTIQTTVTASGTTAYPANSNGFNAGDTVFFYQTQGTSRVGWWEYSTISTINSPTNWTLKKTLVSAYDNSNGLAQVIKVPQYMNVTIQPGGVLNAPSWNGATGGILVYKAKGIVSIQGSIQVNGGNGSTITGNCNNSSGGGIGGGYRGGNGFRQTHREDVCGWNNFMGAGFQGEGVYGFGTHSIYGNWNGGGGGSGGYKTDGSEAPGGGAGGGGANQTAGGNGGNNPGYGGNLIVPGGDLVIFGGGGGGSQKWYSYNAAGGGSGGGGIVITAKNLTVSGSIQTNGGNGGYGGDYEMGGGGGAGGTILLQAETATLGSNLVTSIGGSGGGGGEGIGGNGGNGFVYVQYCNNKSGDSYPSAVSVKLNCYIVKQDPSDQTGSSTLLNLPETFNNGQTYQIQYGRKVDFAASGIQTTTLRLPAGLLASGTLDALISGVGTGTLNFSLDIGNHGAWDWASSSSITDSATLSSQNLATAFNTYWSTHGAPSTGTIDVPIRVSMDKPGQVLLTNLQVTPGGSKLRYLRIPANTYSTVTLNYTLSGGSGPATVAIDVGANGSIDGTWSGFPASYPTSLTSLNLATAVNAYLTGKTGEVDVPIRFFVAPDHTLALNSFSTLRTNKPDAGVSNSDLALPGTSPVEGDTVTVRVTLHNTTAQNTGALTAAFYATSPDWGDWYIGSDLVYNISPNGGTALASVTWNTMGFTGAVPVKVVVDPYNRLAESSEVNNQATATLTVLTRPDLALATLTLSDAEPVVGETVGLSLTEHNQGQTLAGASHLKVYDGDPAKGGILICDNAISTIAGGLDQLSTCNWSPTQAGAHRLFVVSDAAQAVPEFDEGNNLSWQDVYVGLAGPIQIDSGLAAQDLTYTSTTGFGFVDPGADDKLVACSTGGEADPRLSTLRRDPGGKIVYRFDHLLPHHSYHLDLILYECDGAGRQESIAIDDTPTLGPIDLGDAQAHYLSIRLDPALYQTDRSIQVAITVPDTSGAVLAAINLTDVDYRYADAGGAPDPRYSAAGGAGWLDGTADQTYGKLPYQSIRVNQDSNTLQYRYDGLKIDKRYQLHLTFWQPSGTPHLQKIQVDGIDSGQLIDTGDYQIHPLTISVPQVAYATDGSIVVAIQRTNATGGAILNEIALEELTLQQPLTCADLNVRATPYFTETYGALTLFGLPAAVGEARVEALTPRGEVVGCFVVNTEGQYGLMRVYGEDLTTQPVTPGARAGERITFRVNGSYAYATPASYWQNDHAAHNVDLELKALTDQSIPLSTGWNLISFNVEPPSPLVQMLLGSALTRTNRVIGETGIYAPSLDPAFVTLKELHANQGYYLLLNGTTTLNWLVSGTPVAATQPIALHTGWNWIGGPRSSMPVATALQGIAGHYKRVLSLNKTYDPSLSPSFSTLKDLKPGEGYLIYATDPVSFTYPAAAGDTLPAPGTDKTDLPCSGIHPTPALTIVYGDVRINKTPAPAGTRVEIRTPRGELAGCALIAEPGLLALTHVYGAENESTGFREGEPLSFYINGLRAASDQPLAWSNNRDINEIHLSGGGSAIYLPWVNGR